MDGRTSLSRRSFFGFGLAAASALTLRRTACGWPLGDELRIAVIGLHGRGRDHVESFRKLPGVRVVAVCDVDAKVLGAEVDRLAKEGVKVDGVKDARTLFDRKDIDAISIATPNHWHALLTVWACMAGKDVYVEKPVSHSVWEGRQMVLAARRYGRIVQAGTQSRSSYAIGDAIAWLRKKELGDIQLVRGLCYKPRKSIGKVDGPQPVPEGVDYDLWTGPAAMQPLRRKNLHYDWHWVHETGNGDLGNQGVHQMDIARWALGENGPPKTVLSIGGRLGYSDDGETPNTQLVLFGYPTPLLFEVRGLPRDGAAQQGDWNAGMDSFMDTRIGVVVHCENGWLRIPDYGSAQAYDADGKEIQSWQGATDHFENFVKVVKSRRLEHLHADIEAGHQSSALCHYGNISQYLGKAASSEELNGAVAAVSSGFAPLGKALDRMLEHIGKNGIDLAKTPLTLGRRLTMTRLPDGGIHFDDEADCLLTRSYREPFKVPAI